MVPLDIAICQLNTVAVPITSSNSGLHPKIVAVGISKLLLYTKPALQQTATKLVTRKTTKELRINFPPQEVPGQNEMRFGEDK